MSRIGNLPIDLPETVKFELNDRVVKITGPKGALERRLPRSIEVEKKDIKLFVYNRKDTKEARSLHGTTRALLANMVKGLTEGWTKQLEMVGTGYRGEVSGNTLTLNVGYSHPIKFVAPEGVTFKVEKTDITVSGIDKEIVGLTAARIRAVRPPEPYKGKGIKIKGEIIRRKAGKAAKTAGA